jgi:hypothetical protein
MTSLLAPIKAASSEQNGEIEPKTEIEIAKMQEQFAPNN